MSDLLRNHVSPVWHLFLNPPSLSCQYLPAGYNKLFVFHWSLWCSIMIYKSVFWVRLYFWSWLCAVAFMLALCLAFFFFWLSLLFRSFLVFLHSVLLTWGNPFSIGCRLQPSLVSVCHNEALCLFMLME